MLDDLRGMFAFAIWDSAKKALLLARDPYGIKPLYYANDGWTLRFASQVKALLTSPRVSRQAEPAGVAGFYLFGSVPEPYTLYQEIRSVPAGSYQWVSPTGPAQAVRYFSLAKAWGSPGKLSQGLTGELQQTVESRVAGFRSPPPGVRRSGGCISVGRNRLGDARRADEGRRAAGHPHRDARLQGVRGNARRRITAGGADGGVARGAAHRPDGDGGRIPRGPAPHSRRDGPAVRRRHQHVVREQGGTRGRAQGRRVRRRRRRTVRRILVVSRRPPMGAAALAADAGPWRGSIFEQAVQAFRPLFPGVHPKTAGLLRYGGSYHGAWLLRRGLYLPSELPALLGNEMAREGIRRLRPLEHVRCALDPAQVRPSAPTAAGFPRSRKSPCSTPSSTSGTSCCATPIGRAWRTHWRYGLPWWTGCCSKRWGRLLAENGGNLKPLLAQSPSRPLERETLARAKTGFLTPVADWQRRLPQPAPLPGHAGAAEDAHGPADGAGP